jgi:hypothetical protein
MPATEAEWLADTRGKTVRDVEDMVSGLKQGDRPSDPPEPGAERHYLRLELSGDSLAAWREAGKHLELEVGAARCRFSSTRCMPRSFACRPG